MIHPDKLDITDPERIEDAIETVRQMDILINNMGYGFVLTVEDMEETEMFGQSLLRFKLHTYVQKLCSEETNLLLKEESLTIGEVVKRVGYKHQEYFSKSFFAT
jgi:NAD(P)-dependent dehydrogenase (short-subunit alcohol dehydrogenase family)